MLNVLFAASLIAAAAASDQLAAGVLPKTILVAAATANTGGNLVKQLSLEGKVDIKAAVRARDDVRATELAALPRVTVVVLDFDDVATVSAALAGVDRAFLVSAPFDNLQFERETDFLALAGAEGIPTVRVGTYTGLYGAGTKTSYGRAHHGIEAYADINGIPTVTLRRVNPRHDVSLQKAALSNHLYLFFFFADEYVCVCARRFMYYDDVIIFRPNWFFDNLLFGAAEIKAAGQITYPASGNGLKSAFVDPRDVASAAATILMLPGDLLATFVAAQSIEVHGPKMLNLAENIKVRARGVPQLRTRRCILLCAHRLMHTHALCAPTKCMYSLSLHAPPPPHTHTRIPRPTTKQVLAEAVGYPIKINEAPIGAWVDAMVGYGMPRVHAR